MGVLSIGSKVLRQAIQAAVTPGEISSSIQVEISGHGTTSDIFSVSELATESIAAAGRALTGLIGGEKVCVDQRLASFWFHMSIRPQEFEMPGVWDEFAGDYVTRDGWIRLHTNARTHREAALKVLGSPGDAKQARSRVSRWSKEDLEQAVVDAGGAAAAMCSAEQWSAHHHGQFLSDHPLVQWDVEQADGQPFSLAGNRPLDGLKVLDLTRILAGPVATRLLAAFGADVLRIDPPGWDEPAVIPEMTPGKRCATLNLGDAEGRRQFKRLIENANIIVHGYRADALDRIGLGDEARRELNPSLIDVRLNAYGWQGPWRNRRGFDSLVQMSSGIADLGMRTAHDEKPRPMTCQALDHATGYLMVASVLNALSHQARTGQASRARLSLAATAEFLKRNGIRSSFPEPQQLFTRECEDDWSSDLEQTSWGAARRLKFPLQIPDIDIGWKSPATALHTSPALWL